MKVYVVQESDVDGSWEHGAYLSKEKAQALVDADNLIYDQWMKDYQDWSGRQSAALKAHTESFNSEDYDFVAATEVLRIWREANPSPPRPEMLSICNRLYVKVLEVEE